MPTYFKPLRRKIGVLTLAMACVLMVFWTRSCSVMDRIELPIKFELAVQFVSLDGYFSFELWNTPGQWPSTKWETASLEQAPYPYIAGGASYGIIVIILTLLSAWMLLSRARAKKTPAPPTDSLS